MVRLAKVPAEIHLSTAHLGPEIDEPSVGVLHFDAELGDLTKERLDLAGDGIGRSPAVRRHAALQILEERSDRRQHGVRLGAREYRHMLWREYRARGPKVPTSEGELMATYVLLTKVSAAGVKTIQSNPRRIKEVNTEIEALGARVVAQYATLGRYDFVNIVEAKDNETIARISVALGARGTVQIETLPALPVETFIRNVSRKGK